MGNSASRAIKPGGLVRRLPQAPKEVNESVLVQKIEQDEAQRTKELADEEELGRKDTPLNDLLTKLQGAIHPKSVKVVGQEEASTSSSGDHGAKATVMSASDFRQPIPLYTPSAQPRQVQQQDRQEGIAGARAQGSPWLAAQDEEKGRAQAFALREVLEAKNLVEHLRSQAVQEARAKWSMRSDAEAVHSSSQESKASVSAEAERSKELDVTELASRHGLDVAKLELLVKHTCIPVMGRFKTFGHEYVFARPPQWWLHGTNTEQQPQYRPTFKSEPAQKPNSTAR